jgi:glycyl-tRNA synthetase beta chain
MPAFFLELFSEEIPARMQAPAAEALRRTFAEAAAALAPAALEAFSGPRRIALAAEVLACTPVAASTERGPRASAPEQALAGFLRKHGATREALRQDGDFWVLDKSVAAVDAARVIASVMPGLLRRFAWPKSMRWGGTSSFTWIRPLRRIVCLLDGAVVPFNLAEGDDDGHGLASGDVTEGHRMHGARAFSVAGREDWTEKLFAHKVMVSAPARADAIWHSLKQRAADGSISLVEDHGLLEEVAGLVEWPVALLGRIDDTFMDLPPEVMQVSMRVNQRYFATRGPDGAPAPFFAFAANIEAQDGGAAIVAGNERVLRARFSDARHFWDLDRRTALADRVAALDRIVFHAELGTQGARVRRIVRLAGVLAPLVGADAACAERAALLCKADLTTGMVGEFPELQGVMGGYYAAHDGEDVRVAAAIREHYAPKGAADGVPRDAVAAAVALADKLDQLAGFFAIGQKPTGSGDPFALRRAALGAIRIIRENNLRVPLLPVLREACKELSDQPGSVAADILAFIIDRLRVQLRGEGARHDVLAAVFAANTDDDLTRALARTEAIASLLRTEDGANLLAAYRRATNILRIEDKRDGPHRGAVEPELLIEPDEQALAEAWRGAAETSRLLRAERFAEAMLRLAALRPLLDAFFATVTVNAEDARLRLNRLRLLNRLRESLDEVADFSAVET